MKKALRYLLIVGLMALLVVPVLAQASQTIAFGETIEGEIEDNQPASYTFRGKADQLVSITLISDDFDALLVLLGPDGQELAVNDDGGPGSLNSRIGPYPLPEDGEYTIVVESYSNYYSTFSGSLDGEYTLMLEEIVFQTIEYTQVVNGELADNTQDYYRFHGEAGDVVSIAVSSEEFGAWIQLLSDGDLLSSDDAWSSDTTALIGGYALPSSGDFVVLVESSSGEGGAYTLTVDRIEAQSLSLGDAVDIKFGPNNLVSYFSFEGAADDIVNLVVSGGRTFDTTMALNSPDGYQIAYNDDYTNLNPALMNQVLPEDGTYTVIIQPYQTGLEGAVTLTFERGMLTSLDDGPATVDMSGEHTNDTLIFTGVAGENVRLVVEVLDGEQASPSIAIMQGDESLAYVSGTTVGYLAFDFTIPDDGNVLVQIDEYSYSDVTLRVTLQRPDEGAAPAPVEPPAEATKETPKATEVPPQPTVTAPASSEATAEPTAEATAPAGSGEAPAATAEPEATEAA